MIPHFFNPNIHPYREYERRYQTVLELCGSRSWELLVGTYELEEFFNRVSGAHPERCFECFRLRLEATARLASEEGIGVISTTLLISPYQDQASIREAGLEAAKRFDVDFLFEDFRPGYQEGASESRDLGLYRQGYCGCLFSERERYQKSDPPGL